MLWMYQRVMYGEITHAENRQLTDLSGREIALMVPILILMFWIGFYPSTFLRKMDASSKHLLEQIGTERVIAECGVRSAECGIWERGVLQATRGGKIP
jgi:NADH:ubiquinone oxidoreductase subunit 4 (subunit M)